MVLPDSEDESKDRAIPAPATRAMKVLLLCFIMVVFSDSNIRKKPQIRTYLTVNTFADEKILPSSEIPSTTIS